jgi:hypothetical protein
MLKDYKTMKITRKQLRKLIRESMLDFPIGFMNRLSQSFDTELMPGKGANRVLKITKHFDDGCKVIIDFAFLDVTRGDDLDLYLSDLSTYDSNNIPNPDCYRKGYAKTAMNEFLSIVDQYDISVDLTAASQNKERFPNRRLVQFYQDLGFDYGGNPNKSWVEMSRDRKSDDINEGYLTDYAKHSTMNLGQVLRHLRYITDLPNTPKLEAIKKRLRWLVNDIYYTITPGQWHHTQGELDELSQYSYGDLLKMGFDPDFADEVLSNASLE